MYAVVASLTFVSALYASAVVGMECDEDKPATPTIIMPEGGTVEKTYIDQDWSECYTYECDPEQT